MIKQNSLPVCWNGKYINKGQQVKIMSEELEFLSAKLKETASIQYLPKIFEYRSWNDTTSKNKQKKQ